MSAFNDLTGNSGRAPWTIGRARFDPATLSLSAASAEPVLSASALPGSDFAFVADPFRIAGPNGDYVFAEVWNRRVERGQIAAFTLRADGIAAKAEIVLEEPFHLSYPCVFRHGGDFYMLPEAWEYRALILYRARQFPRCWERHAELLTLDYADPQIFSHDGLWYIFLTADPLSNRTAHLYWSDRLASGWRSHPMNPIIEDARYARSAGPLLPHDGRILRFSQDCSKRYGQAVFASEIQDLSPCCFAARPLGPVALNRPHWARDAFHHLDVHICDGVYRAWFDGCAAVSTSRDRSARQKSCGVSVR